MNSTLLQSAMMLPFLHFIPALFFLAGCVSTNSPAGDSFVEAQSSEPFHLEIGQSAQIQGTSGELALTFEDVVNDSRCPIGVECVWEGEAVVAIHIKLPDGTEESMELTLGVTREHPPATIGDWKISIVELLPYPVADEQPDTYTAGFLVEVD